MEKAKTLKNAELRELASTLPTILYHGLAENTTDKYQRAWIKWCDWSSNPAEPFFVSLYLNHVLFTKGKVGSIISAFYGIRWGHHIVGLISPTDNPLVKLVFEGCQRLCPHESCRKEPISPETIKELVNTILSNESSLLELRTVIVCVLRFSGVFPNRRTFECKIERYND